MKRRAASHCVKQHLIQRYMEESRCSAQPGLGLAIRNNSFDWSGLACALSHGTAPLTEQLAECQLACWGMCPRTGQIRPHGTDEGCKLLSLFRVKACLHDTQPAATQQSQQTSRADVSALTKTHSCSCGLSRWISPWGKVSSVLQFAAISSCQCCLDFALPSCQAAKMQAIRGFLPPATAVHKQKQHRVGGHQLPKAAATSLCLRVGQKRPRTWATRSSASAEQLSSQTAQLPALQSTSPQPLQGDGQIPAAPGVYAVYDAQGTLQYIGLSRKASAGCVCVNRCLCQCCSA